MVVTGNAGTIAGGHLEYYKAHGLAPVAYRTDDLRAHLERRDSLYRSLGLPPAAFKGVRVLEVAPGTGQNSLYVAHCGPASLDLVEPNPAGLSAIAAAYDAFPLPHTIPAVHAIRLEEFAPKSTFDIVLCENWLGGLPREMMLIKKLASLVAPGGVLVLTVVPVSGFFANVMRKLLAHRVLPPDLDFDAQTRLLVEAFGPHLATLADMTRSHRDWVHDCLLNPHYLNVALPLDAVLSAVGGELESMATLPRFGSEWRWFKAITGERRRFNEGLTDAYRRNVHNFVDYRRVWPERAPDTNAELDRTFHALHASAVAWQSAWRGENGAAAASRAGEIRDHLEAIATRLVEVDPDLGSALTELLAVWTAPSVTVSTIQGMDHFKALFGRETVYLSMTRPFAP
jgi:SAM-dependent methyltransferase